MLSSPSASAVAEPIISPRPQAQAFTIHFMVSSVVSTCLTSCFGQEGYQTSCPADTGENALLEQPEAFPASQRIRSRPRGSLYAVVVVAILRPEFGLAAIDGAQHR